MAKKQPPNSDLMELLKLLRRIFVLAVAAYGLVKGMPYPALGLRLAILWAILYVSSGLIDVAFRYLSYRAALHAASVTNAEMNPASASIQKAKS